MKETGWGLRPQWSQMHKKIAKDRSDRGSNTGNGLRSENMATLTPSSESAPGRETCRESQLLRTEPSRLFRSSHTHPAEWQWCPMWLHLFR